MRKYPGVYSPQIIPFAPLTEQCSWWYPIRFLTLALGIQHKAPSLRNIEEHPDGEHFLIVSQPESASEVHLT